jgi:diguanylate cyclase (GGDEF)-like protein/PAS domain S-box-containing protein
MVSRKTRRASGGKADADRLERVLEASGLGLWEMDVDTGAFSADERTVRGLGYAPGAIALSWETFVAIIHPDDAIRVSRVTEAHLRGETPQIDYDARVLTQAGTWTWVRSQGRAQRDAGGKAVLLRGTLKNVDAEHAVQQRLAVADTQLQQILGSTDEGIVGLDRNGVCTFVNPAATRLLGLREERLLGHNFDEQVRHTGEDGVELIGHDSPIVRCLLKGEPGRGADQQFRHESGTPVAVEYSVSPLYDEGRPAGAVLVFRDVGEKRKLAQQLEHQALHDPLTGLVNRRGFEARLAALLQSARTQNREHALCYLDLDHFKLVNDTCGHVAGDELLRQLPGLLQPRLRRTDTIARLGGDEFALLLEDCALDQAARIAGAVRDTIRDFRFQWQYRNFAIGASVGVVGITAASQGLVAVLGAADAACYVAKDNGQNHVHVSYPHDLAIVRRRGEMRWVARLKTALEEGQFRLHYMSIAPLAGGPALHHELLLRLADGKGELVLPGAFLPAAERYQLMPQIDDWVIRTAARAIGELRARQPGLERHRFGINLSGESLRDPALLERVRDTLRQHDVPASMLYFEFTETAAIANLGAAVEFMRGLRDLGCQLALDDFGSGMSSFSYLKQLPVDFLKIDGSFIRGVVTDAVDQAIVRAVLAVSQQMNIPTMAEYVENEGIRGYLAGLGIHYGQGYAIARPTPIEEFAAPALPQAARA